NNSAVRHRGDNQSALRIERQPVRADQQDRNPAARYSLRAGVRRVTAREAALRQEDRKRLPRRPLVNLVPGVVAEQQISIVPLLYPYWSFGQTKVVPECFELRVRRYKLVESG